MPVTYSRADESAYDILTNVLESFHRDLLAAGVSIDILFAHPPVDANGDSTGPAIKHHGYAAIAVVRIVNLRDRTKGGGDAEIIIDEDEWQLRNDEERLAILDHEISHLQLVHDKKGNLKRDSLDRPKLKMRLHDRQFGFFDDVAQRHGDASIEVQQARRFFEGDAYRQMYLPGMSPAAADAA